MKKYETKKSNVLLWLALAIFLFETLVIVGYYWLFGGYFGVASLTISRFVGLGLASALGFGIGNTLIVILLLYYLSTHARIKYWLWHLLMVGFTGCLMALSIFPHLANDFAVARVHQIFAAIMFVVMALVGIVSLIIAQHKSAIILATLFVTFSIYFILSYISRPDYFTQNILFFETSYILAFFGLTICANSKQSQQ